MHPVSFENPLLVLTKMNTKKKPLNAPKSFDRFIYLIDIFDKFFSHGGASVQVVV